MCVNEQIQWASRHSQSLGHGTRVVAVLLWLASLLTTEAERKINTSQEVDHNCHTVSVSVRCKIMDTDESSSEKNTDAGRETPPPTYEEFTYHISRVKRLRHSSIISIKGNGLKSNPTTVHCWKCKRKVITNTRNILNRSGEVTALITCLLWWVRLAQRLTQQLIPLLTHVTLQSSLCHLSHPSVDEESALSYPLVSTLPCPNWWSNLQTRTKETLVTLGL